MADTSLGYESAYTGEQIDEAVGAVLGGSGTSSLSDRMTAVEGDVGTLGTTVSGHTSDIGTLSGKFTALGSKADDIQSLAEITKITVKNGAIQDTGKLGTGNTYGHGVLPVEEGDVYIIENQSQSSDTVRYIFATTDTWTQGSSEAIPRVGDLGVVNRASQKAVVIPEGCTHLWWNSKGYQSKIYGFDKSEDVTKSDIENAFKKAVSSIEREQKAQLGNWAEGSFTGSVGNAATWNSQTNWRHSGLMTIPEDAVEVTAKIGYRSSGQFHGIVFVDDEDVVIATVESPSGQGTGTYFNVSCKVPEGATSFYVVTGINNGPTMAGCESAYILRSVEKVVENGILCTDMESNLGSIANYAAKVSGHTVGFGSSTNWGHYEMAIPEGAKAITWKHWWRSTSYMADIILTDENDKVLAVVYGKAGAQNTLISMTADIPEGATKAYLTTAKTGVTLSSCSCKFSYYPQGAIENMNNRIDAIERGETEKEWVASERARIAALIAEIRTHKLVIFGFNTDQHIYSGNKDAVLRGLQALRKMAEYHNFDLIVLGGDDTYGTHSDPDDVVNEMVMVRNEAETTACPVVDIAGNHETRTNFNGGDLSKITADTIYRHKAARTVARCHVVYAAPLGTNIIIDDDVKECRYVFMDGWSLMDDGNGGKIGCGHTVGGYWKYYFVETMEKAVADEKLRGSGWKVYLFCHNVIAPAEEGASGNTVAPLFENLASTWNSIIETAIANGVNVVAGFNGHNHTVSWRNNHGIPFMSTASAGMANDNANGFENRKYYHTGNTATETLFDVYVHDITTQRLYALAYGAPSDRIWDLSGNEAVLLICDLSGTVTGSDSVEGYKVKAKYHNTEFTATLGASGEYEFPYLTPEREWSIVVEDLSGNEVYSDTVEPTASERTKTKNISLT